MTLVIEAVKLGKQGRLVVPASLRRELGLELGDELIVRTEDGRLIFEPRAAVVARLRERFNNIEGSLADELIAERREEAARETEGELADELIAERREEAARETEGE